MFEEKLSQKYSETYEEIKSFVINGSLMNLPAAETAGYLGYIVIPQTHFTKGDLRKPHSRDRGVLKI
jgi:hypothetical protein